MCVAYYKGMRYNTKTFIRYPCDILSLFHNLSTKIYNTQFRLQAQHRFLSSMFHIQSSHWCHPTNKKVDRQNE